MQAGFGIVNPSGVGIYKLVIENEIAHFTAGAVTAGNQTWTLARGQEGTTAASHASGVTVALEETKGTVDNMIQLTPTAQQTGTVNVSGAITSGGLLTGTGLTAPHASSHLGGSDSLVSLLQLAGGPGIQNYTAWPYDLAFANAGFSPTAGVIYLTKIGCPYAFTINVIDTYLVRGGTGVTALANCFVGIYDSSGARQFVSSDQSSPWAASTSLQSITVSGGYVVTAGSFIYIAHLIGTQATTTAQFVQAPTQGSLQMGFNLTAATYRSAFNGAAQTSLPNPITLSNNAHSTQILWVGLH